MNRRQSQARLPSIAVESQTHLVRLALPEELHQRLEEYARYFHAASGRKPLTMNHVIVGLLESYLAADAAFHQWRGKKEGGGVGGAAAPLAARRQGAAGE